MPAPLARYSIVLGFLLLQGQLGVLYAESSKTIDVVLTQPLTDTGLQVSAGQLINISASGTMNWYTGECNNQCLSSPAGQACPYTGFYAQGLSCWSLIGQVGNGAPFEVGTSLTFTPVSSGELYLGVNDNQYPDNTGQWTAVIRTTCKSHLENLKDYKDGQRHALSASEIFPPVKVPTPPGAMCSAIVVEQSPNPLYLSTGDDEKAIISTFGPPSMAISPKFEVVLTSNPHSNCAASLDFEGQSGTSPLSASVTAAPEGCSGIFSVAVSGGNLFSKKSTTVVVPPQVMIQTLVGEAGAQITPGDATMPALLLVAQNRFGDQNFPGGKTGTWQAVLTPAQFYGASNTTDDGTEPELDIASQVFSATSPVTIPTGCEAYWSPNDDQFSTLQEWANKTAEDISDADWKSLDTVGAPDLWHGSPKQAVIKKSIANNVLGGYKTAPAIVLFRKAASVNDPAVVIIP